jgi:hypothetical protein
MPKTVFILGAGASAKAGVPLMNDFLDKARTLWKEGKVSKEDEEHFENVFKGISSLQQIHSKSQLDINNLESVFATFEMANRLNKMPGFNEEEIPALVKSMRRLIVVTIEKSLKFPVSNGNLKVPEPYDQFASILKKLKSNAIPPQEISILTFNYDLATDYALQYYNLGFDYCLPNSMKSEADRIKLLKLHGSLNWGITKEHENIRPWELQKFLSTKTYLSHNKYALVTPGSDFKTYENDSLNLEYKDEPVIIPPTWNKSSFHSDLEKVWTEAANQLEQAENLFIIGFSLPETDIFFRHLYALGTAGNIPFNRFWVFDPDKKGIVKERYENLLGPGAKSRFKFHHKKFKEAIGIIEDSYNFRN